MDVMVRHCYTVGWSQASHECNNKDYHLTFFSMINVNKMYLSLLVDLITKTYFSYIMNSLMMIKIIIITFDFNIFLFYYFLTRWTFRWNYRILENIWPAAVSNKDSSCCITKFNRKSLLLRVKDQELMTSINYTQCTWWGSNSKQ